MEIRQDALIAVIGAGRQAGDRGDGRGPAASRTLPRLHFFSPVPAMKLFEVVAGAATAEHIFDAAMALVLRRGKRVVTARDEAALRTLAPFANGAVASFHGLSRTVGGPILQPEE